MQLRELSQRRRLGNQPEGRPVDPLEALVPFIPLAVPDERRLHMLNNLSGIGALQEALDTTNSLLADVLAELKETNSERLEAIAAELRVLNDIAQSGATSTGARGGS